MSASREQAIGTIEKRGDCIRARHRHAFTAALRALPDGEYQLSLSPPQRNRSLQQNAWLWGVALPMLADAIGYDRHEHDLLHYELLAARFGTREHKGLILPAQGSSTLTTAEFADYMEWLVRFAAEQFGVVLPLPGEV